MCITWWIFNNHLIADFPENLSVKNVKNWLRFDEVTAMSLVSLSSFLWDMVYVAWSV